MSLSEAGLGDIRLVIQVERCDRRHSHKAERHIGTQERQTRAERSKGL